MIYCIGLRAKYDAALARPGTVMKEGARANYFGGSVWQTNEDAASFIERNGLTLTHAVYGVDAAWETDTRQLAGEPYRRLIRAAAVIRLAHLVGDTQA